MLALAKIAIQLITDALRFCVLMFRPIRSVQAENLFLRRQLALYKERGVRSQRVDPATRISLAVLAGLFNWREALVVVRPETMIRWHRAGWKLFWRFKSRPGRPTIPAELRALIRRMAGENPLWGEERIASELLVKLGIRVSPRTVGKYMPKRPEGQPRGDQRWAAFLRNHARAILACDFFVAITATFQLLYVFVVIEHGSRRLVRVDVTAHPTAEWALQQLREVIGDEGSHQYLIHDRDTIFARNLDDSIQALGLSVLKSPIRSPKLPDGSVRQVEPDWSGKLSGFTLLFEALVLALCREMTFTGVARVVNLSTYRVMAICSCYVDQAVAQADYAEIKHLAIDETSRARGHDYVTLAADADRRAVIFVTEGRGG